MVSPTPKSDRWYDIIDSPRAGLSGDENGKMRCTARQVWSNGLYRAPVHRVLANRERERHSVPFFYNPSYDSNIAPVPSCGRPRCVLCFSSHTLAPGSMLLLLLLLCVGMHRRSPPLGSVC